MNKTLTKGLAAIIMAILCSVSFAKEYSEKPKEKIVGKWDNHAGIISFLVKDVDGKKQARMLVASEHLEGESSKLSIDMLPDELDELEEMVEATLTLVAKADTLPIPPLDAKEVTTAIGSTIYPNSKLTLAIVDPAGTQRYASMVVKTTDKKNQYVFWLEKEDLTVLKNLLDKTMLALK